MDGEHRAVGSCQPSAISFQNPESRNHVSRYWEEEPPSESSGIKDMVTVQLLNVLKSKIHRATVTDANVDYVGSITIDRDLMERSGIREYELVHVWNVTNGERFETYALPGEKRSGVICVNGAAAHLVKKGDKVIIVAFVLTDEEIEPKMVLVDDDNMFLRYL